MLLRSILFIFLGLILVSAPSVRAQSSGHAMECVVLLHGLGRTERAMRVLGHFLVRQGYDVVNHDYPSTQYRIEKLATDALPEATKACPKPSRIHFVTHSMGGILLRQYLSTNKIPRMGRVVMLGPPNKGSELIDVLHNFVGKGHQQAISGLQLSTRPDSVPNRLGPANFELGVIAGTKSYTPLFSRILPGPDDGKVTVHSTRLEGMKDHLTLPVNHSTMMRDQTVMDAVWYFLAYGEFPR